MEYVYSLNQRLLHPISQIWQPEDLFGTICGVLPLGNKVLSELEELKTYQPKDEVTADFNIS